MLAVTVTAVRFFVLVQDLCFLQKRSKFRLDFAIAMCRLLFLSHAIALVLPQSIGRQHLNFVFLFHILYACVRMVIYEFLFLFFYFLLFTFFLIFRVRLFLRKKVHFIRSLPLLYFQFQRRSVVFTQARYTNAIYSN